MQIKPLSEAKPTRNLRDLQVLWSRSSRLMIGDRIRFNTNRLVGVRLPERALSNTWWPLLLREGVDTERHEKAVILWINSTLGLILLLIRRQETEGPWMQFKKPILANLPIIDLRGLSDNQLDILASTYDRLAQNELKPFAEINTDESRAEIDTAIGRVFNIPDLSRIRRLLAKEPVVCIKPLYATE